ncbi:MAG: hypothetical protein HY049_05350 [Acidobacteria bacterium]|nr:hypothetical protein [Acidobacteriota bacterium]
MTSSSSTQTPDRSLSVFFTISACSWMPHWACHFFRLGTGSTFAVGSWSFSALDSAVSLGVYGIIVLINILATTHTGFRPAAAFTSGLGHLGIGAVHVWRLISPFRFEILGQSWPLSASAVQATILLPFSLLCFLVFVKVMRR